MKESYYNKYLRSFSESLNGLSVQDSEGGPLHPEEGFDRLCGLSKEVGDQKGCQYLCGNGASAAFANHMALDWSKNGKVPTLSFSDSALLTAIVNDMGGDEIFAAPLRFYAQEGGLLVTISSSGNSPNILRAIEVAREMKLRVVTFSGLKPDNASRKLGDLNFYIPAKTYGIVECAHQVLLHVWLDKFIGVCEWEKTETQNMRAAEFQL